MKVLVFTSLYPNNIWPNHGVFIKERMTHFAKLDGCEVKVVAPVPYFPSVELNWRCRYSHVAHLEIRDGIEVYHPRYFMTPKVGMMFYALLMFLAVLMTVKKIRREFDFDLIDAHWVYPDGFAAVLLGRIFNRPVVVSARGSDINSYRRLPLIRGILQYTLRKADRVIAVSKALQNAIVQLGIPDGKISVIPNGVDMGKFHPLAKDIARQKLGLPLDGKIILCVGHLTVNKGIDLVIRAMRILLQKCPTRKMHLIIVGDGVFREELGKLVSALGLDQLVSFRGGVPHERLFIFYSAADLLCLASEIEGWPNVLLESIACGTPVVATFAGGIPEIIRSENVGLLTERDDVKIAEAIDMALNKRWQSNDLVEYAKENSWGRTARAVLHVFESIIDWQRRQYCGDAANDQANTSTIMGD